MTTEPTTPHDWSIDLLMHHRQLHPDCAVADIWMPEAEARDATGLRDTADATATKLEHWGNQFFPRGGWMTHWAISFRALASELRAALAAAPPEPRLPSRDELAKALDEALRALNSGDMRDWEAYPSNVKRARAILADLREGGER